MKVREDLVLSPASPKSAGRVKRQKPKPPAVPLDLGAGGEMAERISAFDWSSTPLGPMEHWSPALRTTLRIILASGFPQLLWWGPQYIQLYNDPYRAIPGAKHPEQALGQPASKCWAEIWHIIGPLIDRPFHGGPPSWDDDILLEIRRSAMVEETHFTIAYSPVPDETVAGGIGGVLATVHEITGKVVGDRRVVLLRDLAARSTQARTAEEACALAAQTMSAHPSDIPFALLYLNDPKRQRAALAGVAGTLAGQLISPSLIPLEGSQLSTSPWPLHEVLLSESTRVVFDLRARFGSAVPPGPWSDPPDTAVIVPIRSNRAHVLAGFLVAGVSSRLELNEKYFDFLNLVSSQIATTIANARDYEEEKKRAEALAEIDRAKTAFFSNVSHEFRTPLTLMLGPLEELLTPDASHLAPEVREPIQVAHRNSLRLLRLVNTLLDFSRIEAGRTTARFEATDLAAFTAELASVFRAATERAGLQLTLDCPPLSQAVYVDPEMWEKILLNLLSNAFKFTFEGGITVTLREAEGMAELRVRDTGAGIPAEEMPRLFERFHRIENTRSRTHEGSGIGLALIQELLKLHGGAVRAESQPGQGATFIVTVPLGHDHLPAEHISCKRVRHSGSTAAPFIEEALRWLPEVSPAEQAHPQPRPAAVQGSHRPVLTRPRVLIADDNADMRGYLARLLASSYDVHTVPDGKSALAAAREHRPDLLLTDVMMPHMDGCELVRELRRDPSLRTVPIILLSARAGEESRVEGLEQGADDYLVKPFSARELTARVAAHLDLARLRQQTEQALREAAARYEQQVRLFDGVASTTPDFVYVFDLQGRFLYANRRLLEVWGMHLPDIIGKTCRELGYEQWHHDMHMREIAQVIETKQPIKGEVPFRAPRTGIFGVYEYIFTPVIGPDGAVELIAGTTRDVTEHTEFQVRLERQVSERTAKLQELVGELEHFSYAIVHDMRAPLRAMKGFAEIITESSGDLSPELQDYLRRISLSAERMDKLITEALNYSQAVRQELPLATVKPSELLRGMVETYPEFQPDRARIRVQEQMPAVLAHQAGLTQCFSNLLDNAVKFVENGTKPDIHIWAETRQPWVRIWLEDNGVGISKAMLPRVFDMFSRGNNRNAGTGIGLALVRKIAQRMGGRLGVESEPGKGSRFWLELQLAGSGAKDPCVR